MIYLDNAATTPVDDRVLEDMIPFMKSSFGNAGSPHALGASARDAVEKARAQVADLMGTTPEHIVFTSGGSEANTLAVVGAFRHIEKRLAKSKDDTFAIAMSPIEHESVMRAMDCVFGRAKQNCYVISLPLRNLLGKGEVAVDGFYNGKLALVAVMFYNNEVNISFDPKKIAQSAHDQGALYHVDCVQAAGYAEIDVEKFGCDTASISSHKIYGPKGVGALYVRDKRLLSPIICGSAQQEFGLRGGTENVAGIVGFGKACELATAELSDRRATVDTLVDQFVSRLLHHAHSYSLDDIVHFNQVGSRGKNVSVRFDGVDAQTLIMMLSNLNIYVSAGSACHGKSTDASHVLLELGMTNEQAHNTLRVSLSSKNTMQEVDIAAKHIILCVHALLKGDL